MSRGAGRSLPRIVLKPGREKPVLGGHPWIFSGAVERLEGPDEPGQACEVVDSGGRRLGFGYVNTRSQIVCRLVGDEPPGVALWARRLESALALRVRLGLAVAADTAAASPAAPAVVPAVAPAAASPAVPAAPATDAYRLVNAEGDFLPGLVIDRYGPGLCVQITTAGMERWRDELVALLEERLAPAFIYERSDAPLRREEGLPPRSGLLRGELPDPLVVREAGLELAVDLARGHKTGLYLDQRENRILAGRLARDAAVLNCFCYTGGFSLHAAAGGARSVVSVDLAREAVELARANLARNGFAAAAAQVARADVFRQLRQDKERYDLVVLDPPKFARRESEVEGASRGYRDINRLALARLAPGGWLLTFSCSQAVGLLLFQKVVLEAAKEGGHEVQVAARLGAAPDHPFNACHREGEYLKGLLLRRLD